MLLLAILLAGCGSTAGPWVMCGACTDQAREKIDPRSVQPIAPPLVEHAIGLLNGRQWRELSATEAAEISVREPADSGFHLYLVRGVADTHSAGRPDLGYFILWRCTNGAIENDCVITRAEPFPRIRRWPVVLSLPSRPTEVAVCIIRNADRQTLWGAAVPGL